MESIKRAIQRLGTEFRDFLDESFFFTKLVPFWETRVIYFFRLLFQNIQHYHNVNVK